MDSNERSKGIPIPSYPGPNVVVPMVPATPPQACLGNCDVDDLVQPTPEECEGYSLYLHLPELCALQKVRLWAGWSNENVVRPALHSLEMVFRMIASVVSDTRSYSNKDEWLRRLENLANFQIEIISLICEGDYNAPTTKLAASTSPTGSGAVSGASRSSQESLLVRLATWKKAQGVVARLQFFIEGHMLRMPFTLGLGEPNLSGKPILEYDKLCTPLEVYACRQSMQSYPEDHALSTAHQIMEAWLAVAQGLLQSVLDKINAADSEGAAKKCWILERVWKLFTSTMDLLQVMDPDDFMRLKHELAINGGTTKRFGASNVAYCLRSTMLRTVTKACKELRHLVPKVVGVQADPKGGPRLQEAVMVLYHSHGLKTRGFPYGRPYAYHSGTIHLLQAFQAIEIAVRQFYFSYQQLVITVMGSGEYKGAVQSDLSGVDALTQLYAEPPYFPSLDGARTFLGDFWHHSSSTKSKSIRQKPASTVNSTDVPSAATAPPPTEEQVPVGILLHSDYQRAQQQLLEKAATSNTAARLPNNFKTLV